MTGGGDIPDWDDLRLLSILLRSRSLGEAARRLDVPQSTVSRRLRRIEQGLGRPLFERSSDGLAPTAEARSLAADLEGMERAAAAAGLSLRNGASELTGRITVTSLDWLGDHLVAPLAAGFVARHPGVSVELLNDWARFNIARGEAQIAVRFGSFDQQDAILQRTLCRVAYGLYASPDYLAARGAPVWGDGEGHLLVGLHAGAGVVAFTSWSQGLLPRAQVGFRANSLWSHLESVRAGHVLAVLPRVIGDARGDLVRLAPPAPEPVRPVHLGVHRQTRSLSHVGAFVDFLAAGLARRAPN